MPSNSTTMSPIVCFQYIFGGVSGCCYNAYMIKIWYNLINNRLCIVTLSLSFELFSLFSFSLLLWIAGDDFDFSVLLYNTKGDYRFLFVHFKIKLCTLYYTFIVVPILLEAAYAGLSLWLSQSELMIVVFDYIKFWCAFIEYCTYKN